MKNYLPTENEIESLFFIAPFLYDALQINNNYFNDDDTSDEQRKIIFESTKNIYKSLLKIINSNKNLPFG